MKIHFAGIILILLLIPVCAQGETPLPTPTPTASPKPTQVRLGHATPPGAKPPATKPPTTAACFDAPSKLTLSPKPIDKNEDLREWLRTETGTRRLVKVVPVNNSRSLFWFTPEGTGGGWNYEVYAFAAPLDEYNLKEQIEAVRDRFKNAKILQFLGLHELDQN